MTVDLLTVSPDGRAMKTFDAGPGLSAFRRGGSVLLFGLDPVHAGHASSLCGRCSRSAATGRRGGRGGGGARAVCCGWCCCVVGRSLRGGEKCVSGVNGPPAMKPPYIAPNEKRRRRKNEKLVSC